MGRYCVFVRAELIDEETGDRITWDTDEFHVEGPKHRGRELYGAVTEAAGLAAAQFTRSDPEAK